jgi:hypothetical protein
MTRYKREENQSGDGNNVRNQIRDLPWHFSAKGGGTHAADSWIHGREELEAVAYFPARLDCLSGRDKFRSRPGRFEGFVPDFPVKEAGMSSLR